MAIVFAWVTMLPLYIRSAARAGTTEIATGIAAVMPTIDIGTAVGAPGQTVVLAATLRSGGAPIAGTQNDLEFDALTPVHRRQTPALRPDCTIGDDFGPLQGSAFLFTPTDCLLGVDCNVRVVILGVDPMPIPDGTVLYSCRVDIDPGATPGSYPVGCTNFYAANPQGLGLVIGCDAGAVVVVAASPTPTPTPTAGGGINDGGCQVAAATLGSPAWVSALLAAVLLRRRGRRRSS